jgi:hypothetical protein
MIQHVGGGGSFPRKQPDKQPDDLFRSMVQVM